MKDNLQMEATPQHPVDKTDRLRNYYLASEQLTLISECPQIQCMAMFLAASSPLSLHVSYSC